MSTNNKMPKGNKAINLHLKCLSQDPNNKKDNPPPTQQVATLHKHRGIQVAPAPANFNKLLQQGLTIKPLNKLKQKQVLTIVRDPNKFMVLTPIMKAMLNLPMMNVANLLLNMHLSSPATTLPHHLQESRSMEDQQEETTSCQLMAVSQS